MLLGEIDWIGLRLAVTGVVALVGMAVAHCAIPIALGVVWWRRRREIGKLTLTISFFCLFGLSVVIVWLDAAMFHRLGNTHVLATTVLIVAILRSVSAIYIIRVTMWVMSESQSAKMRELAERITDSSYDLISSNERLKLAWRSEMDEREKTLRLLDEKRMLISTLERQLAVRARIEEIEATVRTYKDTTE
jgi:hypothetical protein